MTMAVAKVDLLLASQLMLLLLLPLLSSAFVVLPPQTSAWRRKTTTTTPSLIFQQASSINDDDQNDDEEKIVYNDFDFVIGGEDADADEGDIGDEGGSETAEAASSFSSFLDTTNSYSSSLQDRMKELVVNEQESQELVSENWKSGHWSVRGCSLGGESSVKVSCLCAYDDDVLLVGRTDGSVCWLQLGHDYLATFTNQLVAKETSDGNGGMTVGEELKRTEELSKASLSSSDNKFEILAQFQASQKGEAVVDMVVVDSKYLLLVTQDEPNRIVQLPISEDGPQSSTTNAAVVLPDVHGSLSPLISLRHVPTRLNNDDDDDDDDSSSSHVVMSTSRNDGKVVMWNVGDGATTSSKPIAQFDIPIDTDDDAILSCDVDARYAYFGSAEGMVWIYSLADIFLNEDSSTTPHKPQPLKSFSAFTNGGVSAICAAGEGTMGRNAKTTTTSLVTGSTLGEMKQWELIPRGENNNAGLEYWPKLASQTMPGKAHVFKSRGDEAEEILSIWAIQKDVLLSATRQGLTIWDPATGKVSFDMQGLEFGDTTTTTPNPTNSCSVVVVSDSLLVTNGMAQYVCVHDFSIAPFDEEEVENMIDRDNDGDDEDW
jgi:hypothetical protein